MTLEQAIKQVAEELNLPYDVCYKAYMSSWKFILTKIQEFPLSKDLPEEEFDKLRTNFNMPSLGKFYVTKDSFLKKQQRLKMLEELKQNKDAENKED